MRRVTLALVGLGTAAGLAACAPFHAGAAATVGPNRIATSTLRSIVTRGLAVVPATATAVSATTLQQQTLTELVRLQILQAMASQEHVTVTSEDIGAVLTSAANQNGGLAALDASANAAGIANQDLRTYAEVSAYMTAVEAAVPLPQAQLEAAYSAQIASFEEVHVAHILVSSESLADTIYAEVTADPSRFAALAAEYSIDTGTKDKGGDLGFAPRSAYVAPFAAAAFAGTDGTIVGPVHSQYGWHVIKIIQHKTLSLAEATPQLRTSLGPAAFLAAYQAEEKKLGVHVSPRFGAWSTSNASDGYGDVIALPASDDLSVVPDATPTPSTSAAQ